MKRARLIPRRPGGGKNAPVPRGGEFAASAGGGPAAALETPPTKWVPPELDVSALDELHGLTTVRRERDVNGTAHIVSQPPLAEPDPPPPPGVEVTLPTGNKSSWSVETDALAALHDLATAERRRDPDGNLRRLGT